MSRPLAPFVLDPHGPFGAAVCRALRARGLPVRGGVVPGSSAALPEGVHAVVVEPTDLAAVLEAAEGCDAHVFAWRPGVERAANDRVRASQHLAEAAAQGGGTLVVPGDIYGYKPVYGVKLPAWGCRRDANDPPSPRGDASNLIDDAIEQNAHLRGVRTILLRSTDWFGAGVDDGPIADMFRAALAGRPIRWPGALGAAHGFTWVDDVAEAAVRLLLAEPRPYVAAPASEDDPEEDPREANTFRKVPRTEAYGVGGHVLTADALAAALAKAAGTAPVPPTHGAAWPDRLAGLFDPAARARLEVAWTWADAVELDDAPLLERLGDFAPASLDDAVAATMAWFRTERSR